MNDLQIRPIEHRLKRYDVMVSGKARFYAKDGKLLADVSADELIFALDLSEERDWTKEASKHSPNYLSSLVSPSNTLIASATSETTILTSLPEPKMEPTG
jgi:hypothetical protein